ncbi:hypothetical protein NECAME_11534 [Necator americanus]|uniref:Uncharacterized protein n=1 Tax=Necator americanus TaxID=51031 RepID=W2T6K6_NECAM|nr:hypothetical protein NECAME_11534 [Necator americanus]ETN76632.1 hypothetical protein NECAME_11534 [Necator americanus]
MSLSDGRQMLSNLEELEHYEIEEVVHDFQVSDTPYLQEQTQSSHPDVKREARTLSGTDVRRQPHRNSRVKSFRKLLDSSNRGDSDEEQKANCLEVAPARVFVTNDVVGMHLDWPLYSQQVESFATIAYIIVSDAALVRSSLICMTVPQEFTEVGTFVIAMSSLQNRHEVTLDGLGSWGSPQGTTKFYHFCPSTRKLITATPEDYTFKSTANVAIQD